MSIFARDLSNFRAIAHGGTLSRKLSAWFSDLAGLATSFAAFLLGVVEKNIYDYGATGDGVTDDLAAFTAASLAAGYRGSVKVPSGIFRTSASIRPQWSNQNWNFYHAVIKPLDSSTQDVFVVGGTNLGTATITVASPGVVTLAAHGLIANSPIRFSSTGVLPYPLVADQAYFVAAAGLATNTFEVTDTPSGAALNMAGVQSGTHTLFTGCNDVHFNGNGTSLIDCNMANVSPLAAAIQADNASGIWFDNFQIQNSATLVLYFLQCSNHKARNNRFANIGKDQTHPGTACIHSQTDNATDQTDFEFSGNVIDLARNYQPGGVATMTIASPCVVTLAAHGFADNAQIRITTSGSLPTGFLPTGIYFVLAGSQTANTFQLTATLGGVVAINATGSQSGTHTIGKSGWDTCGMLLRGESSSGRTKRGRVHSNKIILPTFAGLTDAPGSGAGVEARNSSLVDYFNNICIGGFEGLGVGGAGSIVRNNWLINNHTYGLEVGWGDYDIHDNYITGTRGWPIHSTLGATIKIHDNIIDTPDGSYAMNNVSIPGAWCIRNYQCTDLEVYNNTLIVATDQIHGIDINNCQRFKLNGNKGIAPGMTNSNFIELHNSANQYGVVNDNQSNFPHAFLNISDTPTAPVSLKDNQDNGGAGILGTLGAIVCRDNDGIPDSIIDYYRATTPNTTATVTVSIATPAVITWTAHGLVAGSRVVLTTSSSLPTGITAGTPYWVIAAGLAANTFQISATAFGSAINTSGSQAGTQTGTSAVPTSHLTATDLAALQLPVGEWYVDGLIGSIPAASTTTDLILRWASTTSATLPAFPNYAMDRRPISTGGLQDYNVIPQLHLVLAAPTTVYLSTEIGIAVSTMSAGGAIWARRAR